MPFYAKLDFYNVKENCWKRRKNPVNPGKTWQRKVRKNYVKSIIHLPRQGERTTECVVKSRAELGIVRQS